MEKRKLSLAGYVNKRNENFTTLIFFFQTPRKKMTSISLSAYIFKNSPRIFYSKIDTNLPLSKMLASKVELPPGKKNATPPTSLQKIKFENPLRVENRNSMIPYKSSLPKKRLPNS